MNSSSEQRLIERMHALDVSVRTLETLVREHVLPNISELHDDAKRLLGFRATLLGWAAGVSGAVSILITLGLAWLKH